LALATTIVSSVSLPDEDHETARRLRGEGTILPLQEILKRIGRLYHAQVLEVELDDEEGRYVYEIELLSPRGRVWKFKFDAHTGDMLESEKRR
jgi:uncharacterized membrane protein YkoI